MLTARNRKKLGVMGVLDQNGHADMYNLKGRESHKVHHTDLTLKKHANGVHTIHAVHDNGSKSVRIVGRLK